MIARSDGNPLPIDKMPPTQSLEIALIISGYNRDWDENLRRVSGRASEIEVEEIERK
jgi:hypothetical protein